MIDPHKANYGGTPVAPWRLKLGYAPALADAPPVLSIVTPFYEGGALFRETVQSVMGQSLQDWEWIVVDDGSTDPASLTCLEGIAREDARIRLIRHEENRGRSAARNTGIAAARTGFIYPLDQDDLLEPTALEKCLWWLATHPEHAFANAWCVGFGAQSYLWNRGFDREEEFLVENQVSGRALIRRAVFDRVGGYDEAFRDGFEDWDFWLRCADHGLWGHTLPESLEWFRRKSPPASWEDPAQVAAHRERLAARYPRLAAGAFPRIARRAERAAPPPEAPPFDLRLAPRLRRLLMVACDVDAHANGALLLSFAELLYKQNWQLTVAVAGACDAAFELALDRYSADVHVLDRIVGPADQPRYLHHLVRSRGPAFVLFEAGEYGRAMTRHLRAQCPEPRYLEIAHDDPNQPGVVPDRDGPRAATPLFDLTLCTTRALADALATPRREGRIEIVPPGVDTTVWKPRREPRRWLRPHWGAEPGDAVVLIPGAITERNRPWLVARTLRELAQREVPFRAVFQGDGEESEWLRRFLERHGLESRVVIEATPSPDWLLKSMAAADLLFSPADRGLSMHVLRAMAMGLPIVALASEALRSVATVDAAILAEPAGDDDEVRRHADAIARLAADPELRGRMGHAARRRVLGRGGVDRTAGHLLKVLRDVPAPRRPGRDRRAYARAVEHAVLRGRADALARDRGAIARESARRADRIRELEAWNAAQTTARSWLEEQVRNWQSTAEQAREAIARLERAVAERDRLGAERARWVEQLEQARDWLEGQRANWHAIAESHARRLGELERSVRELDADARKLAGERDAWRAQAEAHASRIAALEAEIARTAERLATLSQRWWPGALRQGTAEAGRALRSAERPTQ